MPFMKGRGSLRRTMEFLKKGSLYLRDDVKIVTFQYTPPFPEDKITPHSGLFNFVFWHLPQLKFKNPEVQFVTFKQLTPSPWIRAHLDDDSTMLIDCFGRSRQEIHEHVKLVLCNTEEMQTVQELDNTKPYSEANFGLDYPRQCICEIPGQVPCPGWQQLPKEMTGKWQRKMALEKEEEAY